MGSKLVKEFIEIYSKNRMDIESFLMNTLKNNAEIHNEATRYKENFKNFPSMELLYITDEIGIQVSPNIYPNKSKKESKGKSRGYLENKLIKKNEQFSISEPYLSADTGSVCVTVMKKETDHHIFMDFNLKELLSQLGLIELHQTFDNFTKLFYTLIGFSLMFFAFLAIGYAIVTFFSHLFSTEFSLDKLFKPIVALTLSLAIFDLAKTILEREVYFKSYSKENEENMILTKFSIAIVIALSIEALMLVFKIALHDYTQMMYALYLIIGIGVIIVSLGLYNFLSKKN